MNKTELIIAALAASKGDSYTPVQLQKLLFLIDRNIGKILGGPFFNFIPYHYGPFDRSIYLELEKLRDTDDVEVMSVPSIRWNQYRLSSKGQEKGEELLSKLDGAVSGYISDLSKFVRSLSFPDLLSSIYKAYPEMRVNSIFQG